MIIHYIKIALRNMRKFKLQTIVCLTGLAVGMTCFSLGTLWLRYIESFEDFVPEWENVYYVTGGECNDGHGFNYYTRYNIGKVLMDSVPAVTDYCTISHHFSKSVEGATPSSESGDVEMSSQERGANMKTLVPEENRFVPVSANRVDSTFFDFFGIRPLRGSVEKMEGCIVLTESAARKLYGDEDPLGREIIVNDEIVDQYETPDGGQVAVCERLTVSAIIPDCPQNTQFGYEVLMPLYEKYKTSTYHYSECCTFVKLNPNAKLDDIVGKPIDMEVHETPFKQMPQFVVTDNFNFLIVPLHELRSKFPSDNVLIRTEFVQWFMLLGVLVIVCSVINYLITMVSHIRRRSWEFSLRRVLGSSRRGIVSMVCTETFIILILAALLSSVLNLLILPEFRKYSGIYIPLWEMEKQLALFLRYVIIYGFFAAVFTARFVMKRTQRNILYNHSPSPTLPKGEGVLPEWLFPLLGGQRGASGTVLQMALSMGIVFSLVVMLRQVNHLMYSPEIGFTHRDLGVMGYCSEEVRSRVHHSALADTVLDDYWAIFPRIMGINTEVYDRRGEEPVEIKCDMAYIDQKYIDFFGLQLVYGDWPQEGKYIDEARTQQEVYSLTFGEGGQLIYQYQDVTRHPYDVCVSEAMCRALKVSPENAIGLSIFDKDEYRIGGVVKDIYVMGPLAQPRPVVFRHTEGNQFGPTLLFRAKPGRAQELCDSIEKWGEEYGTPVDAINCEHEYEKYVASEMMLIKILMAVGLASLFVCVIGTFSLVSLSLQQRRKEIAIRKVHGAKVRDILSLFLKGQVMSLLIAAIVAFPIAYVIMRHWLEGYQKQVAIDWWLIPTTFAAIALVVLATIALKIWRAAKESTVEALNA